MNENSELFKQKDLENTISYMSSPDFYSIKSEVSQSLNFFKNKKLKGNKSKKALGLDETKHASKYHISIDGENNLIVLKDKFNENRYIIFAQYTPGALGLHKSLIANMKPGLVLMDKEPYQISELSSEIKDRVNINISKYDTWNTQHEFKEFLKLYNKSKQHIQSDSDTSQRNVENLSGVEGLIMHSLGSKSAKIKLFDVPYHNYVKSFINSVNASENDNYLNDLKSYVTILNLFEIVNWLSVQELHGCKNCASFFDRDEVNWVPLKSEYLIDKNLLPNTKFLNNFRINKVYNSIIQEANKENVLVFAENSRNLCLDFLNYDSDSKYENIDKNSSLIEEFDDFFENEDFKSEFKTSSKIYEGISLAIMLKEDYKNFYKTLPIKMMNVKSESIASIQREMEKDFKDLNGIDTFNKEGRKDLCDFYEDIKSKEIIDSDNLNNEDLTKNRFKKKRVNMNSNGSNKINCEPLKFVKNEMIDFIKEFKH